MPKNHKFPRLQALESQKYVTPQTELYLKMLSQIASNDMEIT